MRRVTLVGAIGLGLVLGWLAVPLVVGGEAGKKPAARPVVSTEAPAAEPPANAPAPAAPSPGAAPAKPKAPEPAAKEADTSPPVPEDITITPPPPLPPVEIPPIPPATEAFPFGEPKPKNDPKAGKAGEKAGKPGELKPAEDQPKTDIGAPIRIIEEGKRIFNREGRVALDDHKQTVFAFGAGEGSIRIIENSWRDFLETSTDFGKKDAHWRVSGLVTVYGHKNYLLITKCVRVMPEEENR